MMRQLKMTLWLVSLILALIFLGQVQSTAAGQMDTSQLTYNIEAQSLKSALEIYQKTSGLNLAYSDDLVQGKMTDGVDGKNTTAQALKKILKDTGLTYTITNQGTVVLRKHKIVVAQRDVEKKEPAEEKEEVKRPVEMEQMVVTARKVEEPAVQVPQQINVLTSKDIEKTGASDVLNAINIRVPGVSFNATPWNATGINFAEGGLQMRGTWRGDRYLKSLVDGVEMGGIPFNREIVLDMLPVQAIERMEFLKGPASALYGGGSIMGTSNLITKKGTDTVTGYVAQGYGSYDNFDSRASILGKTGMLRYHVAFQNVDSDAYTDDYDSLARKALVRLDFEPTLSTNFELLWVGNWNEMNGMWLSGVPEDVLDKDRRQGEDPEGTYDSDLQQILLKGTHFFSDYVELVASFRYQINDDDRVFHVEIPGAFTINRWWDNNLDHYYGEAYVNLTYPIAGMENFFSIGASGTKIDSEDKHYYVFPWADRHKTTDWNETRWGIFFQDRLSLLKNLHLNLGLRYDRVETDTKEVATGFKPIFVDHSLDIDFWSPKVALNWEFVTRHHLFASYARSFRVPWGAFEVQQPGGQQLKEEEADSWEAGYKGTLWNRLDLAFTGYYNKITDAIVGRFDPVLLQNRYSNAVELVHKGFEIETEFRPIKGLSLWANLALDYSEYEDYIDYDMVTGDPIDYSDKKPEFCWRDIVKFGVDYETPWNLKLGISGNYQDNYYIDKENTLKADDFVVFNAYAIYPWEKWELQVNVNNIFDEDCGYLWTAYFGPREYIPVPSTNVMGLLSYRF
ncbi:MAG: TonB-dependent receptor [Proteobacteria bacterium]|nr:TonB-dependent receptor [Pseudomonadota bacterium]